MTRDDFKAAVETALYTALVKEFHKTQSPECKKLLHTMRKLVMRGGKRARPVLLFETYRAYGGGEFTTLIDVAVALEMHHQFLLMHDDVIDNDVVRYNGPNVIGYYRQEQDSKLAMTAESMGVLAGDLIFSFANSMLLNSQHLTTLQKVAILKLIHETNVGVGYGQLLDSINIDPDAKQFDVQNLITIHSLKSALYSSHLPMLCAAELLELPLSERRLIDSFALPFGIVFQLVDDYSDYFMNASAFNNRPKYRDYRQGKITYPLYQGLQLATKKECSYLLKHLADKKVLDLDMMRVVEILDSCGAREASLSFINSYFNKSYTALEALSLTATKRKPLYSLIDAYQIEAM